MANYLPVLLISVNTSNIPDDNALTTIPCGQVDYLSHDWQEEDVWRSWRNMTRQKNEITNGIRLENASWRTWWKQRNKLKTISPETLNWLKDSDVTWLYGPLHTAVDWTPPPKPSPVPDSVDAATPASTHDRLDLHSASPTASRHSQPLRTKPILKHRSISELLTSDLLSPIFSPHESEDEASRQSHSFPFAASDTSSSSNPTTGQKRPPLIHTKSDTHITRLGTSQTFRRNSPPRVQPHVITKLPSHQSSSTVRASGAVRSSVSQDSASSASGSSERTKKKHISFNTFVEQCIAIEKPKSSRAPRRADGFRPGNHVAHDGEVYGGSDEEVEDEPWNGGWDDDDGYEEDREDNFLDEDDPLWLAAHGGAHSRRRHLNGSAIHSDSDSDDGAIEIRPSSYRHSNLAIPTAKKKAPPRSQSTSSSSSTTTTSASSSVPPPRQRRKSASATTHIPPSHLLSHPSTTSAYRPRPVHSSPSDSQYRDHVTIAPIPPTLLKTTGAWEEGFGDEDGPSDDGLWDFTAPKHGVDGQSGNISGKRNRKSVGGCQQEDHSSEGTPVELVYVPPFGSVYGYGRGGHWHDRGEEGDEGEIEELDEVETQVMAPANDQDQDQTPKGTSSVWRHFQQHTTSSSAHDAKPRTNVPIVIVEDDMDISHPTAKGTNEALQRRKGEVASESPGPVPIPVPSRGPHQPEHGNERERGRSLSISPIGTSVTRPPTSAPSGNDDLLSARGRSQSCQDLPSFYNATTVASAPQGEDRRGRPSMRTSCSSTSWRGLNPSRSSQSHSGGRSGGSGSASPNNASASTSPMGSLSPDASDNRLGGIGSACANGRSGGRERERVGSSSSVNNKAAGSNEERRGRDRGRRVIGSTPVPGPGPNSSLVAATSPPDETTSRRKDTGRSSLSPQEVFDVDSQLQKAATNTNVASDIGCATIDMNASICSVSSEGSTATIIPSRPAIASTPSMSTPEHISFPMDVPLIRDDVYRQREFELEQCAMQEAEGRRKIMPTPSNSPTIPMSKPQAADSRDNGTAAGMSGHARSSSTSSQTLPYPQNTPPPKFKLKSPPPIVPSPSLPAFPSTSPSHAPGEVGSPVALSSGMDLVDCRNASRSLERASSGSRERGSAATTPTHREREWAEARRGRYVGVDMSVDVDDTVEDPTSPTMGGQPREETIINKAVEMVSSAGAYLRLWPNPGGT